MVNILKVLPIFNDPNQSLPILMQVWYYIFVISCFLVFYNYAGYAIPIWFLNKLSGKKIVPPASPYTPGLTLIIAAYNEESFIKKKIGNSLEQNYPASQLEIIIVTDGSTDQTPDIVSRYPSIRLLHQPQRQGKSAAVNRAVLQARHDIIVFSDANTLLNKDALLHLAAHYDDRKVGGVSGEKKVVNPGNSGGTKDEKASQAGDGEGMYWKYESFLKKVDSAFYSVVGAAGELWSVRKELYTHLPDNVILDDFILSLKAAAKGFRILYEPKAVAMELPSFSLKDEKKRKVRISAGGFQSIVMLKGLLLFWRHPRLSFLYISHRVLRWTLSPLCMTLALVSNGIIALQTGRRTFVVLLALQLGFYGMALLSPLPFLPRKLGKIFRIPYYFVFMNVSVIQGFFRWLKGSQSSVWEKARRTEGDMVIVDP